MSESTEKPIRVDRIFYPDGSPREETHYRGESCHGPWRQWHPNGVLAREWHYDRHVMADGMHRTWHDSGQLESLCTYRDGNLVEEICYNRSGKRVPSPRDRRLAQERAFLERAAARARDAKPPKRRRRMPSEEVERHAAFIEELLGTTCAPALAWLREEPESGPRFLGELDHAGSVVLVEAFHELGAAEVLAVRIEASEHEPSQTTNHIIVTLPAEPAARARVIAFDRSLARHLGFDGVFDWGQSHEYVMLC